MDLTNKLIELLETYIKEMDLLKQQYKQSKPIEVLYEELINGLNDNNLVDNKMFIAMLLDTIYGNNIYSNEFYQILLQNNQEQLNTFTSKIKEDYQRLKNTNNNLQDRINRNVFVVSSAYRVISCLKYQKPINKYKDDIFNAKRIINYYQISGAISNKDELLLLNELELHNRKIAAKYAYKSEKDYTENLYNEVSNILSMGFPQPDNISVLPNREQTLKNFINEITNTLSTSGIKDTDETIQIIENYKRYNITNDEYRYIINGVLASYLDELISLYELLTDKDIYHRITDRKDVIKNYYLMLDKYLVIQNYYNQIIDDISKDFEEEVTIEEPTIDTQVEKRFIYSRSDVNINKTKLISDMGDIDYEYYEDIYNLLMSFKNGTIGNKQVKLISKAIYGDSGRVLIELKDFNIRIVLQYIKDDIYSVNGVFIKKANTNLPMYNKMKARNAPDVSTEEKLNYQLELAKQTEQELEDLVKNKGRKNGRK